MSRAVATGRHVLRSCVRWLTEQSAQLADDAKRDPPPADVDLVVAALGKASSELLTILETLPKSEKEIA